MNVVISERAERTYVWLAGMALNIAMVTIDSRDSSPLAHWWAQQRGAEVVDENQ